MNARLSRLVAPVAILAGFLVMPWSTHAHELEFTEQDHGEVVVEPHDTHDAPEGSDHNEHLIAGGLITVVFLGLLAHDQLMSRAKANHD